jgi:cytochrome c553
LTPSTNINLTVVLNLNFKLHQGQTVWIKILLVTFIVAFSFPAVADIEMECPQAPATQWRAALKETDLQKRVNANYDGNWSAYIARWERQIDTAKDVKSRKKALIVRFGAKRTPIRGESLDEYIMGMEQRVDTAYCLAERNQIAIDISEIEGQGAAAMAQRRASGKKIAAMIGCPRCHGKQGISKRPEVPHIAGQKLLYIINQLRAFQTGHAVNTLPFGNTMRNEKAMKEWAEKLTSDNKLSVATYYATLKCHDGRAGSEPAMERPRNLDVCLACHGKEGQSISQVVPRLAGQNRKYLIGELRAFRMTKGDPRSFRFKNRRYHQYMSAIAAPLSNKDMAELATWFSSQRCNP